MKRCLSLALGFALIAAGNLWSEVTDAFVAQHQARLGNLVEALDAGQPAMGSIVEKWRSGQQTAAARDLAAYFAEKSFQLELLEPLYFPADYLEQADASLERTFFLLGNWETITPRPDGGPDWSDHGIHGDKERAWMLNRHSFFPNLARAFAETGNTGYQAELNALWQDWILHSPYPARLTFTPQWRPLEVARRILNSWTHLFYENGLLDPETRLLVLCSVVEHGDSLRHHASFWGGNHLISEKLALLTLAVAWPELRDSPEWKAYAIDRVSREIENQTYPDGSYMELANHYQLVVLESTQHFLRLLAFIDPDFRQRPVHARVEAMWDFFAGVMRPDGFGPLNNDSDDEFNAGHVEDAWELFGRSDWLAMATNGRLGRLPVGSASRFFPWAGQVIIRSDWGAQADWIYFDAGPFGSAHQHTDRFHISASLKGRPVLIDSGRFTYLPGPWRDYFSGPEGHSILMLDGRTAAQAPRIVKKPLPIEFQELENAVFAAATSRFESPRSLYGLPSLTAPVPWTRAIIHDKRGFSLIIDHLVTFSNQSLRANWHFHPDVSDEEAVRFLRLVEGPALQASLSRGNEAPPLGGFLGLEYNKRIPAPTVRFSGSIEKPTTLFWLLQDVGDPPVSLELLSQPGAPVAHYRVLQAARTIAEARLRLHPQPALLEYRTY